jgi:hypothetical protein
MSGKIICLYKHGTGFVTVDCIVKQLINGYQGRSKGQRTKDTVFLFLYKVV